jgi:hypothetical protein
MKIFGLVMYWRGDFRTSSHAMCSADGSRILADNPYGFTGREMAQIARNLHARAKNRMVHERGVAFHGSIEDFCSADRRRSSRVQLNLVL